MGLREEYRLTIRFEAILGFAGILALAGSLAPWEFVDSVTGNALHLWQGNIAFIGSWLVILGTLMKYGALNLEEIENLSPYVDGGIGMLGALLILIGVFTFPLEMSAGASLAWGIYLTGFAGLVALFSAYMLYQEGTPSIPRGLGGRGVTP